MRGNLSTNNLASRLAFQILGVRPAEELVVLAVVGAVERQDRIAATD